MDPTYQPLPDNSWMTRFKNNLTELIEFTAIVGAIVVVLHFFVAEPHKVSGSSMVPNFLDGDYIITDKVTKQFSPLQRGEVIILKNPREPSVAFIKRIIGLPGEKIKVANNQVYINGQPLTEPYLPPGTNTFGGAYLPEGEEKTVPANYYFVMGDNRTASSDSREWGPVDKSLVIGHPFLRYWPPDRAALIKNNQKSLPQN